MSHYPDDNVSTMINKFFYETYFVEPAHDDPKRSIKINGPHWSSMKFLSEYIMLCYPDGWASSRMVQPLIEKVFPDLFPFLHAQRATRDCSLKPQSIQVDFQKFGDVMEFYLSIDWLSLFHTAELEERRRGLALRYVIFIIELSSFSKFKILFKEQSHQSTWCRLEDPKNMFWVTNWWVFGQSTIVHLRSWWRKLGFV